MFRGHSNSSYRLLSTLTRDHSIDTNLEIKNYDKLIQIDDIAKCETHRLPIISKELFYLSIGRHLGYPCRMIDWTADLDTALHFLLEKDNDKEGELWCLAIPSNRIENDINPFNISDSLLHIIKEDFLIPHGEGILDSPLGILRMIVQNGFFTVINTKLSTTPINELAETSLNGVKCVNIKLSPQARLNLLTYFHKKQIQQLYISTSNPIIELVKKIYK